MLATVTAQRLNVRALPNVSGPVLGTLVEDAVVDVLDRSGRWCEIPYANRSGYVYGDYLEMATESSSLRGVVTANLLNVRDQPSTRSRVLGLLSRGAQVRPLSRAAGWLEIEFNEQIAYVSATYIELSRTRDSVTRIVDTAVLNVRALPNSRSAILGQVVQGTKISVFSDNAGWSEFTFNGSRAFVASRYVRPLQSDEDDRIPVVDDEDDEVIPVTDDDEGTVTLEPADRLPIGGSATDRTVASTWNRFGGLLGSLSEDKGIDVASSVAIMCVESRGKGFEQNNDDRLIIRFENHKFWKYWGRRNAQAFRRNFQYNADKVWTGHKWRPSARHNWRSFHGNQANEWEVFEFARTLDAGAAMQSISMGAPQIMGFHFERIGYQSVEEMFAEFSSGMGPQITGLFDFFSAAMIRKLNELDFVGFAAGYNGSGQKEKYGRLIENHYRAFKQLRRRA